MIFRSGQATTTLIDTTPELFTFKPRRDRATKLLNFLGNVIVNGNPHAKGYRPAAAPASARRRRTIDRQHAARRHPRPAAGTRGPKKFAEWTLEAEALLVTDTTFRDAHQSLMATRVRTYDMLAAPMPRPPRAGALLAGDVGRRDLRHRDALPQRGPVGTPAPAPRPVPNICFQMLFRGANAVGYTNYPDNVVAGFVKHAAASGMDIFRIFDSLNYLPNLRVAMDAVQETHAVCEAALCYTGDILDPKRDKYPLKYYVKLAKELERMGAHVLAIKDMAGLCRPYAAHKLVKALKEEVGLPIHFHTHDTSGINAASILRAADAGVDIVDLAIASMSGSTAQPNLNSIVAALQHTPRDTGLDLAALERVLRLLGAGAHVLHARSTPRRRPAAPRSTSTRCPAANTPTSRSRPPRWASPTAGPRSRAPTPRSTSSSATSSRSRPRPRSWATWRSSSSARHQARRRRQPRARLHAVPRERDRHAHRRPRLARGRLARADVARRARRQALQGGPGEIQGASLRAEGEKIQNRPAIPLTPSSASSAPSLREAPPRAHRRRTLLAPHVSAVFADFAKHQREYGDVSVLPTPAFFYGLKPREEISVEIEEGKVLIIRLVSVGETDKDGRRPVTYELNGITREVFIQDKSVAATAKSRPKADLADPLQVAAPDPRAHRRALHLGRARRWRRATASS
jgi:pyruvate carboxylase